MTEEELNSNIYSFRSKITYYEEQIKELKKEINELEQLGAQIASMSNQMNGFPDTAKRRFLRIATVVSGIFLQTPIDVLHGAEFVRAIEGLDSAYRAVLERISSNEAEIDESRRKITYFYGEINNCYNTLATLSEEGGR